MDVAMDRRSVAFLILAAALAAMPAAPSWAQEARIKGADIMKHPIGPLALQYVDLIHAGKMDEALKLTTTETQARYRKYPASERTASANFQKKFLPSRAQMEAAIPAGGILIVEGNQATLNIVRMEQKSTAPGTVTSSSETSALPFAMEGGQWRVSMR